METAKVVINGAGSAGVAIGKHLMNLGVKDLIMVDRFGIICEGMEGLNPAHEEMSRKTNPRHITGTLADAMRGADVFIGVSAPGVVTREMVASMNEGACVFPMANPVPETIRMKRWRRARPSSEAEEAIIRTRSITCSLSPAFSAARWTAARRISTRR